MLQVDLYTIIVLRGNITVLSLRQISIPRDDNKFIEIIIARTTRHSDGLMVCCWKVPHGRANEGNWHF